MLPQIKRPTRSEDGEVEIEVVDVRNVDGTELSDDDPTMLATNTLFPKGSGASGKSSRPPASAKSSFGLGNLTNKKRTATFGDEPTRLMPAKHGAKSSVIPAPPVAVPPPVSARPASVRPPPASVRPGSALPQARTPSRAPGAPNSSPPPVANPGTAAEFRPPPVPSRSRPAPPPAFRDREESHTMLRPLGALADNKALHEPKVSIAIPSAGAIKAQVDAARAKRMADHKARAAETLEVTPVSISERFVVQGRPAAPWAVAFVALGIFAGLATAVFTGGRASAIAAFVDPSHLAAAAAVAQPATPPASPIAVVANDPAADMATTTTPAPKADPALDLAPVNTNVFAVGHPTTKSNDTTTSAPVTHAAPKAEKPVAKADPPAAKPEPKPESKPEPKPAPVAETSHVSKPAPSSHGKHGGGGDVDSAAAADALAKAQLENSL